MPAPRCVKCGKIVYPMETVQANDKQFHKWCLKCVVCDATLNASTMHIVGEDTYCKRHGEEKARGVVTDAPLTDEEKAERAAAKAEEDRLREEQAARAREQAEQYAREQALRRREEEVRQARLERFCDVRSQKHQARLASLADREPDWMRHATAAAAAGEGTPDADEGGGAVADDTHVELELGSRRYISHVATDKPIYKPGDVVRVRAVFLHASDHSPLLNTRGRVAVQARVEATGGDETKRKMVQSQIHGSGELAQDSVGAFEWHIPTSQAGGEYVVTVSGHNEDAGLEIGAGSRTFTVKAHSGAPRVKAQLEFVKKGLGAGDVAFATLTVKRADGSVPVDAAISAIARVDGEEIYRSEEGALEISADTGTCVLSFELPRTILDGDGTLTATIDDDGDVSSVSRTIPILLAKVDVVAYPEGGALVSGVQNSVYIQARTPGGDPADIVARVVEVDPATGEALGDDDSDDSDDTGPTSMFGSGSSDDNNSADSSASAAAAAADGSAAVGVVVRTEHEGRGVFTFTPAAGSAYALRVTEPLGVRALVALPAVDEGPLARIALHAAKSVFEAGEPAELELRAGGAADDGPSSSFDVCVYARDAVVGMVRSLSPPAGGEALAVSVPLESSAEGTLRVTVWQVDGFARVPVAERLIYRQPARRLRVAIVSDRDSYAPGDDVSLRVCTVDAATNRPVAANVAITVTDDAVLEWVERRLQPPRLGEMALLESHVTALHDPTAYGLRPDDPKVAEAAREAAAAAEAAGRPAPATPEVAIDLVLGVQGWRRFVFAPTRKMMKALMAKHGERAAVVVGCRSADALEYAFGVAAGDAVAAPPPPPAPSQLQRELMPRRGALMGLTATNGSSRRKPSRSYSRGGGAGRGRGGGGGGGGPPSRPRQMQQMQQQEEAAVLDLLSESSSASSSELSLSEDFSDDDSLGGAMEEKKWGKKKDKKMEELSPREEKIEEKEEAWDDDDDEEEEASGMELIAPAAPMFKGGGGGGGGAPPPPPPAAAAPPPAAPSGGGPPPSGPPPPMRMSSMAKSSSVSSSFSLSLSEVASESVERSRSKMKKKVRGRRRMSPVRHLSSRVPPSSYYGSVVRVFAHTRPDLAELVMRYGGTGPDLGEVPPGRPRHDFTETVYAASSLQTDHQGRATVSFSLSDSLSGFRCIADGFVRGRGPRATTAFGAGESLLHTAQPLGLDVTIPVEVSAGDVVRLPVILRNTLDEALDVRAVKVGTGRSLMSDDIVAEDEDAASAAATAARAGDALPGAVHRAEGSVPDDVVPPEARARALVPLRALPLSDREMFSAGRACQVRVRAAAVGNESGEAVADELVKTVAVVPRGYPRSAWASGVVTSLSEDTAQSEFSITLEETADPSTVVTRGWITPSAQSSLDSAVSALLKTPRGCCEQAAASAYPMVLAQRLLLSRNAPPNAKFTPQIDSGLSKVLDNQLGDNGGFSWWGRHPANEALTAFVMQLFVDAADVAVVDRAALARAVDWLLTRRSGTGRWEITQGNYQFSSPPKEAAEPYITWALLQAGVAPSRLAAEIDWIGKYPKVGDDNYVLALCTIVLARAGQRAGGNGAASSGDADDASAAAAAAGTSAAGALSSSVASAHADNAVAVAKRLAHAQHSDEGFVKGNTSIVRSCGHSLVLETTALAVLAWLAVDQGALSGAFADNISLGVAYIRRHCGRAGMFGSTQSTVLCLKALVAVDEAVYRAREADSDSNATKADTDGPPRVVVSVDGAVVEEVSVPLAGTASPIPMPDLAPHLEAGKTSTIGLVLKGLPHGALSESALDAAVRGADGSGLTSRDTPRRYGTPRVSVGFSSEVRYAATIPESNDECPLSLEVGIADAEVTEGESTEILVSLRNTTETHLGMVCAQISLPGGLDAREKQLTELVRAGKCAAWERRGGREVCLYFDGIDAQQQHDLVIEAAGRVPGTYTGAANSAFVYYTPEWVVWTEAIEATVIPATEERDE